MVLNRGYLRRDSCLRTWILKLYDVCPLLYPDLFTPEQYGDFQPVFRSAVLPNDTETYKQMAKLVRELQQNMIWRETFENR